MKICYISDIHLESGRGVLHIPECDILLLAGDIFSPAFAHSCSQINISNNHKQKLKKRYKKFFYDVSAKAKQTYYVCGNHEFYGTTTKIARELIYDYIDEYENIRLLENESVTHEDIHIFGATLWTDMNRGDPLVTYDIKKQLNDYNYIYLDDLTPIIPEVTIRENSYTRHVLLQFLEKHKDDKTIVMSHHAPSWDCVVDMYKNDKISYAYANVGLDYVLADIGPSFWVHGHMHKKEVKQICERTTVVCNARGYFNESTAKTGSFCEILI